MNQALIKHPQWILAVLREALVDLNFGTTGFSTCDFDTFVQAVESKCLFRQRAALEKDDQMPQLLPYAVPRQMTEDGSWQYFPARRTREGGEPKLWDLVTVAYAGHIDLADAAYKRSGNNEVDVSTVDVKETIIHAVYRELHEELHVMDGAGQEIDLRDLINFTNHYINDNTNNVNIYHLAIMITIDIPKDATVAVKARQGLEIMEPMQAWQLRDIFNQLESWTGIFVDSLYQQDSVAIPMLTQDELTAYANYGAMLKEVVDTIFAPVMVGLDDQAKGYCNRLKAIVEFNYLAQWMKHRGKGVPEPRSLLSSADPFSASIVSNRASHDNDQASPMAPPEMRYPIGSRPGFQSGVSASLTTEKKGYEHPHLNTGNRDD